MDPAAGHTPVLRRQVETLLEPLKRHLFLDCTVGLGGHAEGLLGEAGPDAALVGLDLDEGNLKLARQRLDRFGPRVRLFHANFAQVDEVLAEVGTAHADAILADLGISSRQLDDPARGLSFQVDGPLDMRLDTSAGRTAADLVNSMGEAELADLIYAYGEERFSRRIARRIVMARKDERIEGTLQLADIVQRAMPPEVRHNRRGVHPATRTFQALRIAVNDELGSLEKLLALLPRILAVGGRAAIISFHSLEDRLVKQAFATWSANGGAKNLTKKPLIADEAEVTQNPRSRSAKLRGIERIS